MEIDLAQKAVSAALSGDWSQALKLNKKILTENPKDIDALNRLARAYAEIGNIKKAKDSAEKVLKLDPFNPIASKCLAKWKGLTKGEATGTGPTSGEAFLEEPGKTKIVSLLHLGDSKILAKLDSGDEVYLTPYAHRVSATTYDGKYIGRLPDDLAARLRHFMKYGNEYQVLIKSIAPSEVKVFIRETKRAPDLSDVASFSAERIDYVSFTPPELVHKKEEPIMAVPEGEEETGQ